MIEYLSKIIYEEFENTKGVIRIRKSTDNGKKKKDKRTNNDLQNTTQKTKRSRNTNITKTGGGLRCSGSVSSSCSTSDTRRVTVKQHEHHMTWKSCWTPVYIDKYNNNKNISGIRVTLVLYVCFVDRCLSFCTFSFCHFVVCSSIYRF